jgi:tRNA dimethylallyltransferase
MVTRTESQEEESPLIVVAGPTASGKSALALRLAQEFGGEIVSCDSVAVYREMEIGTAKPSLDEREMVPHHMIDIAWPDEPVTAGEYSRQAREALGGIRERGHVPIVAGGTGLYLRALIDGLFPAPPQKAGRRERLREIATKRGPAYLHRVLARLDREAAEGIHVNDVPKVIRAVEVSLAANEPLTEQWRKGRDELYERINQRAAAMFERGLIEETERLIARYGAECRALGSLGYAEAAAVLRGEMTREQAVAKAQQGHRNYAKRQMTWFRREREMHWLKGCGGDEEVFAEARRLVATHLSVCPA